MRLPISILVLLFSIVSFAGCDSTNTDPEDATVPVRFFNAAARNNGFDVYIDNEKAGETLGFRSSSDLIDVTTGRRDVVFALPLPPDVEERVPFGTFSERFVENESYFVFATGNATVLDMHVIKLDQTVPAGASSRIGALHTIPDGPEVDIILLKDGQDPESTTPLVEDLTYLDYIQSESFDADTYRILVTEKGSLTEIFSVSGKTFEGGKSYTVVLVESAGGGPPYSAEVVEN